MMYEMLSGHLPFDADDVVEVDIRGKRVPLRAVKYPFVREGVVQPGV